MRQEETREKEEREVENLKEELTKASGEEYGTRETNKRQKLIVRVETSEKRERGGNSSLG